MGILHDEWIRLNRDIWAADSTRMELLRLILERHEVTLSAAELQSLDQLIKSGADSIELPADGVDRSILIGSDDLDHAIDVLEKKLDTEGTLNHIIEQTAPDVLASLYNSLPSALREWRALQRGFEKRLRHRWKAGLDRLDMLITMSHEAGETYAEDIRKEDLDDEPPQLGILIEVLTALHCRSCRTAREILCLLQSGYADGAQARWRSLHELAVTAFFLLENRGDTAQRYLDHAATERWRAAKEYQQHCQVLGYEPFSTNEMAEMENASIAATKMYGPPFKEDYGWAAEALSAKRPTFKDIEDSLQMSHWRPFFRHACQSVHAGSRGLHSSLGLPNDSPITLLAGASDTGLADPGHQMAISLTMVTVAFLTVHPNLDGLVACHSMLELCNDIGEELVRIDQATDAADSSSS